MPNIHISEPGSNKENYEIPVVDMIEEKDKEKKRPRNASSYTTYGKFEIILILSLSE